MEVWRAVPTAPDAWATETAVAFAGDAPRPLPVASATVPDGSFMCHTPTYSVQTAVGSLSTFAAPPKYAVSSVADESDGTLTQTSVSPAGSKVSTSNGREVPFSSVTTMSEPSAVRNSADASGGRRTSTGKSAKANSPIFARTVSDGVSVIFFAKSMPSATWRLTIVSVALPASSSMP